MVDYESNPGGTGYLYHHDALGSMRALSDGTDIKEGYDYTVFGEPKISDAYGDPLTQSAYDNPYMFTGRRYDPNTGLYNYRARWYQAAIGRFMQTDPIGYQADYNFYRYVMNNPLNWIDPYGRRGFGGGAYLPGFGRGVPDWHKNRNINNDCPSDEPEPGKSDKCDDNLNPWEKEKVNPAHKGDCYRRKDSTGSGGSQCCYDGKGDLIPRDGSYDYCSPLNSKWGHFCDDYVPYVIWGKLGERHEPF